MKKITLMLCLLFAFSIGMIYSQNTQLPAAIIDNDNGSNYIFAADPLLPDATPADLTNIVQPADKLTMVSSPNPFASRTVIACFLPAKGKLVLEIRNMFGETIKTIENNVEQEGNQSIEVTSENLRPGIYTAMLMFKTSQNVTIKTIRIVYNR